MSKDNIKLKTYSRNRSRVIFYTLMMALPIAQMLIFYVIVNANMFLMAFQKYEYSATSTGYNVSFVFLDNFRTAWVTFTNNFIMVKRSLILFAANMFIGFPLALIFSFYIYKGFALSKFFKLVLFMPQVISGLIFALLFKYLVNDVYVQVVSSITGAEIQYPLSAQSSSELGVIIFYNVWVSFGVKILLFSGSMSGIDNSLVESAELDGVNLYQEFRYITFPLIYPTVVQFIVLGLVGIFTDGMHILALYGKKGERIASFGYYLFIQADKADYVLEGSARHTYSDLSALGLLLTAMTLPVTVIVKKLCNKFGPSTD